MPIYNVSSLSSFRLCTVSYTWFSHSHFVLYKHLPKCFDSVVLVQAQGLRNRKSGLHLWIFYLFSRNTHKIVQLLLNYFRLYIGLHCGQAKWRIAWLSVWWRWILINHWYILKKMITVNSIWNIISMSIIYMHGDRANGCGHVWWI